MQEILHQDVAYIIPFYPQATQAFRTDRFTGWITDMPKVALEQLTNSNAPTELAGTEITMAVDISGDVYSYTLKDGSKVTFNKGDIASAKLRLKIDVFPSRNSARISTTSTFGSCIE